MAKKSEKLEEKTEAVVVTEKTPVSKHPIKDLFGKDFIKAKFTEMLGKKAQGFITSVLQITASNNLLKDADPMSVYNAAATAATLDLPLNNNLGFAYIIPYNVKQPGGGKKVVAQFQIGYKGFIQLAQRSGAFQAISATPILEGQLISENPLTGFVFDFTKKTGDVVIGYAAYFKLLNGFEKTLYMSVEMIKNHGQKYSQSYRKGYGLWKDDFNSMATKTVLKLLLSKFAPLSIAMQQAVISDQSEINDVETQDVVYVDNEDDDIPSVEEKKAAIKENAGGKGQQKIDMP